jgi:hypothetical protein
MKNIFFTAALFTISSLFVCPASYAQQHSDPRWERWEAEMIMDSTYVEGYGVLEYFLYRVDASAMETNIMKEASFHIAFINYLEELNFIVDYGSIRITDNPNLSENVKRLMARHGANVSVTMSMNSNGSIRVIINIDTSYFGPSVLANYDIVTFNVYQK